MLSAALFCNRTVVPAGRLQPVDARLRSHGEQRYPLAGHTIDVCTLRLTFPAIEIMSCCRQSAAVSWCVDAWRLLAYTVLTNIVHAAGPAGEVLPVCRHA
jgi:hypothetical protein